MYDQVRTCHPWKTHVTWMHHRRRAGGKKFQTERCGRGGEHALPVRVALREHRRPRARTCGQTLQRWAAATGRLNKLRTAGVLARLHQNTTPPSPRASPIDPGTGSLFLEYRSPSCLQTSAPLFLVQEQRLGSSLGFPGPVGLLFKSPPHSESWLGCSPTQGRGIRTLPRFVGSAILKSRECFYSLTGWPCRRGGQGSLAALQTSAGGEPDLRSTWYDVSRVSLGTWLAHALQDSGSAL